MLNSDIILSKFALWKIISTLVCVNILDVALRIELVLRINYVRTSITVSDFLMVIDNVISLSTSLLQIHLLSSTGHSDAGRFTEHNLGQAGK